MKIIYILFLLLVVPIALATTERTELFVGRSIEFEGKNISLVVTNFDEDKAVICLDGQKIILTKNNDKTVNRVIFDLRRVNQDSIDLKIDYNCDKNCNSYVSNSACFPKVEEISEEIIENVPECTSNLDCDDGSDLTADNCMNNKCFNVEIQKKEEVILDNVLEKKHSTQQIIGISLLIIVVILGIILMMKREKY